MVSFTKHKQYLLFFHDSAYPWRCSSGLGSLNVVSCLIKFPEALYEQLFCARETGAGGHLQCNVGVSKMIGDIRDKVGFVDTGREELADDVHGNETSGSLTRSRRKDSFATESVHVDAGPGFDVVQMKEAILGNHVDDAVLGADMDRRRKVAFEPGREDNVGNLPGKRRVSTNMRNLSNLELKW